MAFSSSSRASFSGGMVRSFYETASSTQSAVTPAEPVEPIDPVEPVEPDPIEPVEPDPEVPNEAFAWSEQWEWS